MEIRCNNQTSGWNAIQAAIDALPMEGGTVVVPSGSWRSGPIRLRSNMELRLEDGCDIYFNEDPSFYPEVATRFDGIDCIAASPMILADGCTDVFLHGNGTFHVREEAFSVDEKRLAADIASLHDMAVSGISVSERMFQGPDHFLPPVLLQFSNCRNVRLREFTIDGAPHGALRLLRCENTTLQGLTLRTRGKCSPGLVVDSSKRVIVEGCHFSTGSDCIAVSAGAVTDFASGTCPLEDVEIRRCYFAAGRNAFHMGPESAGGIRSILVQDCLIYSTDCGIRISSRKGRSGQICQVLFDGIQINEVREAIHIGCDRSCLSVRDVSIENVTGTNVKTAVSCQPDPDREKPVIELSNIHVEAANESKLQAIG